VTFLDVSVILPLNKLNSVSYPTDFFWSVPFKKVDNYFRFLIQKLESSDQNTLSITFLTAHRSKSKTVYSLMINTVRFTIYNYNEKRFFF
jgi:hypothetical protein